MCSASPACPQLRHCVVVCLSVRTSRPEESIRSRLDHPIAAATRQAGGSSQPFVAAERQKRAPTVPQCLGAFDTGTSPVPRQHSAASQTPRWRSTRDWQIVFDSLSAFSNSRRSDFNNRSNPRLLWRNYRQSETDSCRRKSSLHGSVTIIPNTAITRAQHLFPCSHAILRNA